MRSSITLFDDQYKLYKTGSKKLLIAFVEYMFEWIEPNLKPSEMNIFNSLRERMDNSIKAHDGRSKWWKNSHGWPSKNEPNLNEIWTENEQKMNEKWTENELNLNENAIWDTNSDLQTINSWNNSWTTTIKRKKEDIIISKDIIVDESTEQKIDNAAENLSPEEKAKYEAAKKANAEKNINHIFEKQVRRQEMYPPEFSTTSQTEPIGP